MRSFGNNTGQVIRVNSNEFGVVFTVKDKDTWAGSMIVELDKDTAASLAAYLLRIVAE